MHSLKRHLDRGASSTDTNVLELTLNIRELLLIAIKDNDSKTVAKFLGFFIDNPEMKDIEKSVLDYCYNQGQIIIPDGLSIGKTIYLIRRYGFVSFNEILLNTWVKYKNDLTQVKYHIFGFYKDIELKDNNLPIPVYFFFGIYKSDKIKDLSLFTKIKYNGISIREMLTKKINPISNKKIPREDPPKVFNL